MSLTASAMASSPVTDFQMIHLKATESLGRALDDALRFKDLHIQFFAENNSMQLRIATGKSEHCFQLEQERSHGPTYFSVADVRGSSGIFLGHVVQRLRTVADDESFKHAREGLVKEFEEHRQQKLKTRLYQEESASTLKTERSKTGKRALKLGAKRKQPQLSVDTIPSTTIPHNAKSKCRPVKKQTVSKQPTLAANETDQSSSRTVVSSSEPIKSPILLGTANKVMEATTIKAIEQAQSVSSLRDRCLSAVSRRRGLETRLASALAQTDRAERETLIEEIRSDLFAFVDELLGDPELKTIVPPSLT